MSDPVNHPEHYFAENGMEAIDVIEAFFHDNYFLGNVFKYTARAGKKGDALEDLRKAKVYLAREIARLSKGTGVRVWASLADVPSGTLVETPYDRDYIYIPSPGTGWFVAKEGFQKEETDLPSEGWPVDRPNIKGPFTEVLDG